MGLQRQFVKFHDTIKLTKSDEIYKKVRERDENILADIKAALKEEGWLVVDNFLQGSHSTNTGLKCKADQDYDIDRGIVIDSEDAPDDPVEVKKVILEVMESRGFKNAKIKMPCVTADYTQQNIHLDYPIYISVDGDLDLGIGKRNSDDNNKFWEDSDPQGLRDWINNDKDHQSFFSTLTDKEREQFRRLVRYLKRWRDHRFVVDERKKIYSIGLTVMLRKQFQPSIDSEGFANDLLSLRETLELILNSGDYFTKQLFEEKYDIRVDLPIKPYRDIFEKHGTSVGTKLHKKLSMLLVTLITVEDESNLTKRCEALKKEFGDDFPLPASTAEANKAFAPSAGFVGSSQGA